MRVLASLLCRLARESTILCWIDGLMAPTNSCRVATGAGTLHNLVAPYRRFFLFLCPCFLPRFRSSLHLWARDSASAVSCAPRVLYRRSVADGHLRRSKMLRHVRQARRMLPFPLSPQGLLAQGKCSCHLLNVGLSEKPVSVACFAGFFDEVQKQRVVVE